MAAALLPMVFGPKDAMLMVLNSTDETSMVASRTALRLTAWKWMDVTRMVLKWMAGSSMVLMLTAVTLMDDFRHWGARAGSLRGIVLMTVEIDSPIDHRHRLDHHHVRPDRGP